MCKTDGRKRVEEGKENMKGRKIKRKERGGGKGRIREVDMWRKTWKWKKREVHETDGRGTKSGGMEGKYEEVDMICGEGGEG